MTAVREEISRHLERLFPGAPVTTLAGDASTRRFHRVAALDGTSWVVMDYGAPFVGRPDDVLLSEIFLCAGLPVARIVRVDAEVGCLLLEDLGDRSLEQTLVDSIGDACVYRTWLERAVCLAADVARKGTPVLGSSARAGGPELDPARFRFEMEFFVEHYVIGLRGIGDPPAGLRQELALLADRAAETPKRVLCHRDYHSRNLMVTTDRSLAMVDIQDARWGPDTYDLASLLYDAYVDIDPAWRKPLATTFLKRLGGEIDSEAFRARLGVVAAQRMIKALGTFGYQATVRRARRYLSGVPRTLHRLRDLLPNGPETSTLHRTLSSCGLLDEPD